MSAPARSQTHTPAASEGRSSEHHVVVGLGFLSSLKNGDIDACLDMLHPDVEWHPSPKLVGKDALHGRLQLSPQLQSIYERFAELDVVPEEGRQIGNQVLIVALLKGRNRFTGQDAQARLCWVVTIRDDLWWRIVVYPNPPSARLGFEELLVGAVEARPMVPDKPPADLAGEADAGTDSDAGAEAFAAQAAAGPADSTGLTLTFSLEEAAALSSWLSRPFEGDARVADDADAWPAFVKLRDAVARAEALNEVRGELARVGLDGYHLTDEDVAAIAQGIASAAERFT
jgi:ketosteroid isomerase-like protein